MHRRSSPVPPVDLTGLLLQRRESSPPPGPMRLPAGPPHSSKPSSPATHSFSSLTSPRLGDPFSPVSTSPRSAGFPKEIFEVSINKARDRKFHSDTHLPYGSYFDPHHYSTSRTPPSYSRGSHYAANTELSSRRSVRESPRLPNLTREDTALSSESGHSGHSISLGGNPIPVLPVEPAKTSRILPQPVSVTGPSPSPLDRPMPLQPSFSMPYPQLQSNLQDYRTQGPLAVLVRAGELVARETDSEQMDEDGIE